MEDKTSYAGRHAELYDLFYAEKQYAEEALFVHQCIKKFGILSGRRLLEIACGTGRHAMALEELGYDVVATDYSESMLAQARRKASRGTSRLEFRRLDMRDLDFSGETFDAVVCLFDSIGYVQTNEALVKTLRGVNRALETGGLLVFEFWHAAAMLVGFEPVRVKKWNVKDSEVIRIAETRLDVAKQVAEVHYTVRELRADGTVERFEEVQTNRYFLIQEMAFFLESTGFEPLQWFSGFSWNEFVSRDSWHILAIARKVV